MTSRRPYWFPKTMKRWPCGCPKTNPVGVELFSYANAFFLFQYICIDAGHVSENAL